MSIKLFPCLKMRVKMGNNNNRNSNEGKGFAEYRLWRHEKKSFVLFSSYVLHTNLLTNKYIIITRSQSSYECVCGSLAEQHKERRERCLLLMHTHIYTRRMMMTVEKGLK